MWRRIWIIQDLAKRRSNLLQSSIGNSCHSALNDRGPIEAGARLSTPEQASAAKPLGISRSRASLDYGCTTGLGYRLNSGHARVGRYHLIERLGRGAQGEVWKAVQLEPPIELVALKLLMPASRRDPAKFARFRREAERGAKLASRAILPTYEFGEDNGVVFFAMPLVDGFPLSQVLDQRRRYWVGRPPLQLHRMAVLSKSRYIDAVVRVLARVAWALEDAHTARVVHCDVKPANILLDRGNDERAYLIDFGMGRDLDAMAESRMLGAAGTVLYMAPEKLSGRPSDEVMCDVYALGATAFEALSLKPPRIVPEYVPRSCWTSYLAAAEPPRPSSILPRLPARLEAILERSLAQDPNRRYPSASAMASDLDQFLVEARFHRLQVSCI